jgi:AAA+ ATPase superfamily predicted ATPase
MTGGGGNNGPYLDITLKKFRPKNMPDNSTVLFLGRRRTGKTTCLLDIMRHKRKQLPCGIVVSGTEEANHTFSTVVPPLFIYNKYDPAVVQRLLNRQSALVDKLSTNPSLKVNPNVFCILDDIMTDSSIWKSEVIKEIFFNGRHFKIFFAVCNQYSMLLPPYIRSNIDIVFIMKEPILSNRKRLHEDFCGIVPNFKSLCFILDNTTDN